MIASVSVLNMFLCQSVFISVMKPSIERSSCELITILSLKWFYDQAAILDVQPRRAHLSSDARPVYSESQEARLTVEYCVSKLQTTAFHGRRKQRYVSDARYDFRVGLNLCAS